MKLLSYINHGIEQVGFLQSGLVFALNRLDKRLPQTIDGLLEQWEQLMPLAREMERRVADKPDYYGGQPVEKLQLLAPVPRPSSLRDGYAFRQHVETARRNRRLPMIPEFDRFPVFYFSNHRAVQGPGPVACMPDHFRQLDYELEVAAVIVKRGRNIRAAVANEYIGGLMIMNDLSARGLQMEEMKLSLGPAKGKDFATTTGPWLVTLDELKSFETTAQPEHTGKSWKLDMRCSVNGIALSHGNLSDMQWTFAEIIARASYGVDLYPGDLIGSGTVGTGCLLEINGTAAIDNPDHTPQWLKSNDRIEMEVSGLGRLVNTIQMTDDR
ncbi:MAG TPA: fumarylacetoacetate hydrolase family protein [Puia sp.]|nr:fumarylacetoacetate hydrolase family protein [Puia sp.]